MIEIIALIFLTRSIGVLATRKGRKAAHWKLYTVLAWLGFELVGFMIGWKIGHNASLAMLFGVACGVGGYLLMKYLLDKLPDAQDDWLQKIGSSN
jgi:NhaP-type Na+/H+ or K+/H+ antiporter